MAIRWTLFLLKTGIRGIEIFFFKAQTRVQVKFSVALFHVKLATYLFHCSVFEIFLRERLWPVLQLHFFH